MKNNYINSILLSIENNLSVKIDAHQILFDRRGSLVLKIEINKEISLVKVTDVNFEHPIFSKNDKEIIVEKEANILKHLKEQQTSFGYYIANGVVENYHWLLMQYIEGESIVKILKRFFSESPSIEEAQRKTIELFANVLQKVNELHKLSILHGDIQPAHFKIDEKGVVHILDFGLSRFTTEKQVLYAGALAHFVSPEVAKGMLEKSKFIEYDIYSEIYAIAATLFYLYTRKEPVDYGNPKASFLEKLKAISNNRLLTFKDVEAEPFPILEKVIQKGLMKEKSDRYDSVEAILTNLSFQNGN